MTGRRRRKADDISKTIKPSSSEDVVASLCISLNHGKPSFLLEIVHESRALEELYFGRH